MRSSAARFTGLLTTAVLLSACASSTPPRAAAAPDPSLAPAMTVERFLRAASQRDLDTMASLFGTRDGSVVGRWTRREVDERMLIFANLLRHQDYGIVGEEIVPGRRDEATQLNVRIVLPSGSTVMVPFTLVRTQRNAAWLVESFALDVLTRAR